MLFSESPIGVTKRFDVDGCHDFGFDRCDVIHLDLFERRVCSTLCPEWNPFLVVVSHLLPSGKTQIPFLRLPPFNNYNYNHNHNIMQKRRGAATTQAKKDSVERDSLSIPAADASAPAAPSHSPKGSKTKRRPRRVDAASSLAFDPLVGLFVLFMLAGVFILLMRLFGGGGGRITTTKTLHHDNNKVDQSHRRLLPPLYQFNSLQYPLHHSQLVGLYFAASWCSMSTPVTRMLDEYFGSVLMPPPPPGEKDKAPQQQKPALSIVYISSDKKEEEMKQYVKPNWFVVPFDPATERSDLKRHFSVCARVELAELEMERKFEIPTLIILDGQTQGVLTTSGVQDLYERGAQAIDYWLDLLHKMREMERKYQ